MLQYDNNIIRQDNFKRMKNNIPILVFMILALSHEVAKAQFTENSIGRISFTLLLTKMSTEGAIALQTSTYDIEANATIEKSMILDLQGFNLTNSSVYTCTLTDGKYFALKNTTGNGSFSGKIKFGGTTSILKVLSSDVLATGFSIDSNGASGEMEIGDGINIVTQSINSSQCNGRVSLFTVTSGATLIVSVL
jgi:hypothetical protein